MVTHLGRPSTVPDCRRDAHANGYLKLTHYHLSGVILFDADFSHSNLSGTNLVGALLESTKFVSADLSSAKLARAGVTIRPDDEAGGLAISAGNPDFTNANLREANLTGAYLVNALFEKATLHKAVCKDACLRRASFRLADLTGADFSGARIKGADLESATQDETVWSYRKDSPIRMPEREETGTS